MPRAPRSVVDVLADLSKAMRALRLPWYVFGAQALVLRGLPRATADLDVTVLATSVETQSLVTALRKAGLPIRFGDAAFIRTTRVLPLVHRRTGLPVDVVLGGPGLEEGFAERATRIRVARIHVPVAASTDLVLMKVLAGRPKDVEDATALLRFAPESIDQRALDERASQLARALGEDDLLRNLAEARSRAAR